LRAQEDLLVLVDEALPDGLAVVGERGVVLRVARLVRVHVVVVGGSDDLVRGEDDRQAGVFLRGGGKATHPFGLIAFSL
jgi:hypothetical protein